MVHSAKLSHHAHVLLPAGAGDFENHPDRFRPRRRVHRLNVGPPPIFKMDEGRCPPPVSASSGVRAHPHHRSSHTRSMTFRRTQGRRQQPTFVAELRISAPAEAHRRSVLLPTPDNDPVKVTSRLGRDLSGAAALESGLGCGLAGLRWCGPRGLQLGQQGVHQAPALPG